MKIGSASIVEAPLIEFEEQISIPTEQKQSGRVPNVQVKYRGLPPFATEAECVRTADVKFMQFQCEWLNPLQTAFVPEVQKDNNVVVSGATSSGKTTIAEMVIAHTLGDFRRTCPTAKAAYISPLKALASEKEQDWTSAKHWFYQYNVSILTGDYILTDERKAELAASDIICMSSEMLGSRIRRNKTEKNQWLNDIKVLVVDEAHLLTTEARGANLEVAIMKFTKVNPSCRVIFLSATMPNVDQLGEWLTKLNGKPSTVVRSDYRPVKLDWNWEVFPNSSRNWDYKKNEAAKVAKVFEILQRYPDDKFIVFVHAKKIGRDILELLKHRGITAQFHNADLSKEKRQEVEASFRSRDPQSLRVLVSTSTLAMGLNLPARRVIITGIQRGISMVDSLDILQMAGRSGRVGLDEKGDAHVLIRSTHEKDDREFCRKVEPVLSKISDEDAVAFHLVSEIAEGNVTNPREACEWFRRSLAHHQKLLGEAEEGVEDLLITVLQRLYDCGAIAKTKDDKKIFATTIGKVASWYYFSPFDIADWTTNFRQIMSEDQSPSADTIAWAVGHTSTNIREYSKNAADSEAEYVARVGKVIKGGAVRHCYAIYCLLTGTTPATPEHGAIVSKYRMDSDRLTTAIQALHTIGKYFEQVRHEHVLYELPYRMRYGVERGIELVMLPGVGGKTAEQIMSRRVYTCRELVAAQQTGLPILSESKWEKVRHIAEEIARVGHIQYLKRLRNANKDN